MIFPDFCIENPHFWSDLSQISLEIHMYRLYRGWFSSHFPMNFLWFQRRAKASIATRPTAQRPSQSVATPAPQCRLRCHTPTWGRHAGFRGDLLGIIQMGMDQYLLIPFLVGWTSIYQLFWCSPGVQGFDTLPNRFFLNQHGNFHGNQPSNMGIEFHVDIFTIWIHCLVLSEPTILVLVGYERDSRFMDCDNPLYWKPATNHQPTGFWTLLTRVEFNSEISGVQTGPAGDWFMIFATECLPHSSQDVRGKEGHCEGH
jgi:hypothetical protein